MVETNGESERVKEINAVVTPWWGESSRVIVAGWLGFMVYQRKISR